MARIVALCIAAAFAVPRAAIAQDVYIDTSRLAPFVQLPSIPGITGVTPLTFSAVDDGQVEVTLPFTFNFLAQEMTRVRLGANGLLTLGDATNIFFATTALNEQPGTVVGTNNWIAPLWDDLAHPSLTNARWGVIGTEPNRIFVIEGGPATRVPGLSAGSLYYQVWLYEGAEGKFEYRASGTTPNALNATIGYEGLGGVPFGDPLLCRNRCMANAGWQGRIFTSRRTAPPQLTGQFGDFARGALPGNTAAVDIVLQNLGVTTATAVEARIRLSRNHTLDASDPIVAVIPATDIAGYPDVPISTTITVPPGFARADNFLILEIDTTNIWAEQSETDNIRFSPTRFATGHQLAPLDVTLSGVSGVGPGSQASFEVTVFDDGAPFAGALEVEILLSADQIVDPGDVSLGRAQIDMTGLGAAETHSVTLAVPASIPIGTYYAAVIVDPAGTVAELDETDNAVAGTLPFLVGYDVEIQAIEVPAEISPGASATIVTTLSSNAAPYSGPITYSLYASTDERLDATDPSFGSFSVAMIAGADVIDAQTFTTPVIPLGRYSIIAVADPQNSIPEADELDNTVNSAGTFINGPDFAIGAVSASPLVVDPGDDLTVTGTVLSIGFELSGDVAYRIYISLDEQLNTGDEALYDGVVSIVDSVPAPFTAVVPITNQLPPGVFHILAVANPDGTTGEIDAANNSGASNLFELRGADLSVIEVVAPPVVYMGVPFDAVLRMQNRGTVAAPNFRYAYYFSPNSFITLTDLQVGPTYSATVAAGARATFTTRVIAPVLTSTRSAYFGAILDVDASIAEFSEVNNSRATDTPISVQFPVPDLIGEIWDAPLVAAAGEELPVTRMFGNIGYVASPAFTYEYWLAVDPASSLRDHVVISATAQLGAHGYDVGDDRPILSADIPAGTYHLVLALDPQNAVSESDETNNVVIGPQIAISEATIRVTTSELPDAILGATYSTAVRAIGARILPIEFSIRGGVLPPGLTIDPGTGVIGGIPEAEGYYPFTARASSGAGYADRSLAIRVLWPDGALHILTTRLPSAIAGRNYLADLFAAGGVPPYTWTATSALPEGLAISAGGLVTGVPAAPFHGLIRAAVRDVVGTFVVKDIAIDVRSADQTLLIAQEDLPNAVVGLDYCAPGIVAFEAAGGIPPYSWSILGEIPAGMTFSEDAHLCGAPESTGAFPIMVEVRDQAGDRDVATFILEVGDGRALTIATRSLAAGAIGEMYSEAITASHGDPPYAWSLAGALPPGLAFDQVTGRIAGTPSEAGLFAFLVRAADVRGRADLQALSIEIVDPAAVVPPVNSGGAGCGCDIAAAGVEPRDPASAGSAAALILLLAALRVDRRRRNRARRRQ